MPIACSVVLLYLPAQPHSRDSHTTHTRPPRPTSQSHMPLTPHSRHSCEPADSVHTSFCRDSQRCRSSEFSACCSASSEHSCTKLTHGLTACSTHILHFIFEQFVLLLQLPHNSSAHSMQVAATCTAGDHCSGDSPLFISCSVAACMYLDTVLVAASDGTLCDAMTVLQLGYAVRGRAAPRNC